MLSLFTYGLTYGVAEAQSDTKELGLKLTSSQSFGQTFDAADQGSTQSSESPLQLFWKWFRRGGGGD